MRKALNVILLLLSLALVHAETLPSEDFVIKGFYSLSNNNVYNFRINLSDNSGAQVFHAGVVTSTQEAGNATEIFNWTLDGNSNKTITLSFTITPLQGYLDETGLYYIPNHRFDFYQNATVTYDGSNGGNVENPPKSDSFYEEDVVKSAVFDVMTSGSYPYPDEYQSAPYDSVTITYSGTVANNNAKKWVRSGKCKLTVSEYATTAGIYQYISYIKVVLSVT